METTASQNHLKIALSQHAFCPDVFVQLLISVVSKEAMFCLRVT
jgi:hypothetical protein